VSESFHIVFAITENYFMIISLFIQYYFFENLAQYSYKQKSFEATFIYRGC